MQALIVEFVIRPGFEDAFERAIAANVRSPHFLAMNEATAAWYEAKTVWRCARVAP